MSVLGGNRTLVFQLGVTIKVNTSVSMNNAVLWDLKPCASCKIDVSTECRALILSDLMIEAIISSETSVLISFRRHDISEDGIHKSHRRGSLKSYIALTGWALYRKRNMFPMRYERGFYIAEYGILHSHRSENLKSYIALTG
jgi:hypothetical protein